MTAPDPSPTSPALQGFRDRLLPSLRREFKYLPGVVSQREFLDLIAAELRELRSEIGSAMTTHEEKS